MIQTFTNKDTFINTAILFIRDYAGQHVALSGGNTPKPIYEGLALEWEDSEKMVYQVDERYVPATHAASNQKMIQQTLAPLKKRYINTSLPIKEAIKDYQKGLPPFDLTVLGVGTDGHIGSLFPNTPELSEKKDFVIHTTTDVYEIKDRITLSLPAIRRSKRILILLQGKEKKSVVKEILSGDKTIKDFPVKALLDHPGLTIYYYKGE